LNHETYIGGTTTESIPLAEADPDITIERTKTTIVRYIQMNTVNQPLDVRRASSYAFNYSYYLEHVGGGEDYELHTFIPEGMQYHNQSYVGAPYYNLTHARKLLLESTEPTIDAAIIASGLNASSTDLDWQTITDTAPLFEYNFTRYTSSFVEDTATLLKANLRDIGIDMTVLTPIDWSEWVEIMEDPSLHRRLTYSFGGWGPDYNDPINMIEPLYKTNATNNCFELADAVLDQMMVDSYSATGNDRKVLFDQMQERFHTQSLPVFYMSQDGTTFMWNNKFCSNLDDNFNVLRNFYLYNVLFTPPPVAAIPGFDVVTLFAVAFGTTALLIWKKRRH
jgi:ABC-type oligopeptide transport system substrate-binding subunit